jgi:DNA invertase Pin-like site-specific DNA recombinase
VSDTTSDSWVGSPLYVTMCEALAECGLPETLAADAVITEAHRWSKRTKGKPPWPSPDRATRDRFHALWTAKAQAACGLNPREQTPVNALPAPTVRTMPLPERRQEMRTMYEARIPTTDIAAHFGVDIRLVQRTLRGLGVDLQARLREATPARQRVVALFAELGSPLAVARRLGVSRQAVSRQLHAAGVQMPTEARRHRAVKAAAARWGRAA